MACRANKPELCAQILEVEKVSPDLIMRDQATVTKQQDAFGSKIAQQQQQIEALVVGLQKVSAAVELNKPAVTQVADTR
jgi:hypothetical protein